MYVGNNTDTQTAFFLLIGCFSCRVQSVRRRRRRRKDLCLRVCLLKDSNTSMLKKGGKSPKEKWNERPVNSVRLNIV